MTAESRQQVVERYVSDPCLQNRNALVSAHQYLCRRGARKFFRNTVERADLEQVAAIGLIKASQRYSGLYQTPFEAYAWLVIVGELMHFVRDHERLVRVPRQLRALERKYAKEWEVFIVRNGREPSVRELATVLGVSINIVDELRVMRGKDAQQREGDEEDGQVRASDPMVFSIAGREDSYCLEDRLSLCGALRALSQRELQIIREIFFLDRTQADVGKSLGISQRQVSRLLARVLQRLSRMLAAA